MNCLMISLAGILLLSCGKFESSPYGADSYSNNLNEQSVRAIIKLPATKDSYKVAFISDTHNYYDEMEELIKSINRRDYSFVVHGGDITNFGLNSEFKTSLTFLRKLKVPLVTVPGNHDFLSHGDTIYRRLFGNPNYSFEFQGVHFIMMDNNNWESAEGNYAHEWLAEELRKSNATRFIITSHVPPFDSDRYDEDEIQRWRDIIAPYDVPFYFSGHNHNSFTKTFGNTTHVTIGSANKRLYSEIIITPTGISHKKVRF